jgi:hypothetical protein
MKVRRAFALLALVVAIVPPVALADSAGDQQYTDPLASNTTPTPHPRTHTVAAPSPTPTPAASTASPSAAPPVIASPSGRAVAADPAVAKTLPYTGVEVPLIVTCGMGLLLLGVALRRAARWT